MSWVHRNGSLTKVLENNLNPHRSLKQLLTSSADAVPIQRSLSSHLLILLRRASGPISGNGQAILWLCWVRMAGSCHSSSSLSMWWDSGSPRIATSGRVLEEFLEMLNWGGESLLNVGVTTPWHWKRRKWVKPSTHLSLLPAGRDSATSRHVSLWPCLSNLDRLYGPKLWLKVNSPFWKLLFAR